MIMPTNDHKVLVIDDEMGPRESLRILLKHDFEVHAADSVDSGIDLLKQVRPDVIVMDIRMPGKTGIQGLREIREIDHGVSVIMLTGFGALETAQEAIRLGASDYIKKPFDTTDMVDVIRRNIDRTKINRKREATEQELTQLNQQLIHELSAKDKMASLGQASAELVHDLRNPMTVILGYIQILSEDLKNAGSSTEKSSESSSECVDVIEKSVKRCREMIETWLRIVKNDPSAHREIDCRDVIDEVADQARKSAEHDCSIVVVKSPTPGIVKADPIQLSRALQNILSNAVDALPEKEGCITIEEKVSETDVEIQVTDNGCGIDDANMQKVFDPYHTTKDVERGSGLGLFITRKIVEELHGSIDLQSACGRGTSVTLRIPAVSANTVKAGA